MAAVKPGTLDDTGNLQPKVHPSTENKQDWAVIPDDVKAFEKQPS